MKLKGEIYERHRGTLNRKINLRRKKKLVKVFNASDREKKGGKEKQLLVSCEGHESLYKNKVNTHFLILSNIVCCYALYSSLKMILTAIFIHIVMQTVNIFHY